jgi:hypothetical protein
MKKKINGGPIFPNDVNNKWPAITFATHQIASAPDWIR